MRCCRGCRAPRELRRYGARAQAHRERDAGAGRRPGAGRAARPRRGRRPGRLRHRGLCSARSGSSTGCAMPTRTRPGPPRSAPARCCWRQPASSRGWRRPRTGWRWTNSPSLRRHARVAERVVEQGKIITAAGVSAGIDMALMLAGRDRRRRARHGDPARDRVRPGAAVPRWLARRQPRRRSSSSSGATLSWPSRFTASGSNLSTAFVIFDPRRIADTRRTLRAWQSEPTSSRARSSPRPSWPGCSSEPPR